MSAFVVDTEPRPQLGMLLGRPRWHLAPPQFGDRPFFEFYWGRNAIYHGLRALGVAPGETVLAPAYHCATLVEPLLRHGARVEFYNVRRDGLVDLDDVENKARGAAALLMVHYFGFPQPIGPIRELCRRHELQLIEDCAHVLHGEIEGQPLGSFGDVAVFSWRKFLPVGDGGQLVLNRPDLRLSVDWQKPGPLFGLRALKDYLEAARGGSGAGWLRSAGSTVRRLAGRGRHKGDAPGTRAALAVQSTSVEFDDDIVDLPNTPVARRLCRRVDMQAIADRRVANYARLEEAVRQIPDVEPFFARWPTGHVPWVFPLLAPGRRDFHRTLREHGIPAVAWDGVIHPALPLARFPDAEQLYHGIAFLPIHQDVAAHQIDAMAEALATAARQRRAVSA